MEQEEGAVNDYAQRLIQQLEQAIKLVKESGEDCYICEGLDIAKAIVEAGPDADAAETVKKFIED